MRSFVPVLALLALSALLILHPVKAAAQGAGVGTLYVAPYEVEGGQSVQGTVHLTRPAPEQGLQVTITSGTLLRPPASVYIPPGASMAGFTIYTSAVGESTSVSLQASGGGHMASATVLLKPVEVAVDSVILARDEAIAGDVIRGEVRLARPAPSAGVRVAVTLSGGGATTADVISGAVTGSFSVGTPPSDHGGTVTVTAASGRSSAQAVVRLYPTPRLGDAAVESAPEGGGQGTLLVTLAAAAPPPGALLRLKASGDLRVPPEARVAPGAREARVAVQAGAVRRPTWCAVTVDCYGTTKEVGFYVQPGG